MADTASDRPGSPLDDYIAALTNLYRAARSPKPETIARWIHDKKHHRVAATTIADWVPPRPGVPRDAAKFQYFAECLHSYAGKAWKEDVARRWEQRRDAAYKERRRNSAKPQQHVEAHGAGTHLGRLLAEFVDPIELEVHQPIAIDEAPDPSALPPYVRRDHDARLDDIVAQAAAGRNRMVVLVAGPSTGKTRALWEALPPLREAGWRLWHPWTPMWPQALQDGIAQVEPRTVLWLNETQRYLGAEVTDRERIATSLRELLTDTRRTPVLIVGTLWKDHYDTLIGTHGSAARRLLTEAEIVPVPSAFTGADLAALRRAGDARLNLAAEYADAGQITQYLAGGPALIDRYENQVSPAARAVIEVAMDAVRMGHRNVLPHQFLHDAAATYMSDTDWDETEEENWFEQALAETSRRCMGVRGPVTPIHRRPLRSRTRPRHPEPGVGGTAAGAVYQLADYLDDYGRRTRATHIPRIEFWEAAAEHCDRESQFTLGVTAAARNLRRDAAQLWKNAAGQGDVAAACELAALFQSTHPDDDRPLSWLAAQGFLDDLGSLSPLLNRSETMHPSPHTRITAWVDPDRVRLQHADAEDLHSVLRELQEAGAVHKAKAIATRAATCDTLDIDAQISLLCAMPELVGPEEAKALANRIDLSQLSPADHLEYVGALVYGLHHIGEFEKARAVADLIDPDHLPPVAGFFDLNHVLEILQMGGLPEKAKAVAARVAATIPLDEPAGLAGLVADLSHAGMTEQMKTLAARIDPVAIQVVDHSTEYAADDIARIHFGGLFALITALRDIGENGKATAIAAHIDVTHAGLDNPKRLAAQLKILRELGEHDKAKALADLIDPGKLAITSVSGVTELMREMRSANVAPSNILTALADRASSTTDPHELSALLEALCELGSRQDAITAAGRAAPHVNLSRPTRGIHQLLTILGKLEARTVIDTLVARIDPDQLVARPPYNERGWNVWVSTAAWEKGIHAVTGQLEDLGATELVTAIRARLAEAGRSPVRNTQGGRYVFGRDPSDGSPAPMWTWEDLT